MRDADLLQSLHARLQAEIATLNDQLQQRRAEFEALSVVIESLPESPMRPGPTEELPADFGALVQQHRETAGLTQKQLAERAGVALKTLGNLERGRHAPTRLIGRRLMIALNGLFLASQPPR